MIDGQKRRMSMIAQKKEVGTELNIGRFENPRVRRKEAASTLDTEIE